MGVRLDLINGVMDILRSLRNGRYHVRRGPVNWAKFPFATHRFAIGVSMPEEDDSGQAIVSTIDVEFMTRMPNHANLSIDDKTLEEMRDDSRSLMDELIVRKRTPLGDDPLVISLDRLPTLEIADSELELQGITSTFILEY